MMCPDACFLILFAAPRPQSDTIVLLFYPSEAVSPLFLDCAILFLGSFTMIMPLHGIKIHLNLENVKCYFQSC